MKAIAIFLAGLLLFSCRKDKGKADYKGYPEKVGRIILNHCANSGCHTAESSNTSGNLDLSTWEDLYKGGRSNSVVIPFRPDLSYLFSAVNHFHELGPSSHTSMPSYHQSLNRDELITLRDWIYDGGLNRNGEFKFPDGTSESRIYVSNQGCDLIEVFDARTQLLIRAFNVGKEAQIEAPHDIMVSPDGKFLFVSYYVSNTIEKYSTADNRKVGELILPDFSWHSMAVSGDGKTAIASNLASGKIVVFDLQTMTVKLLTHLYNAHGCALNEDGTLAYVTCQQANYIYKINLSDIDNPIVKEIILETGEMPLAFGAHKPYAVSYFPDFTRYAVTCQGTNELKIFDSANDSLLKTIKTPGVPQLISFSERRPFCFITCMSDISNTQSSSQVNIINYNTFSLVGSVFSGYQPRGLCVDDANDRVWIANRNITANGWQPHHTTTCNGQNGYMSLIDMRTLKVIEEWKCETSVDPYSVTIKK
jgi:DNA-binding beta-propeller fold protein YncE